jgi:hypothetical protein
MPARLRRQTASLLFFTSGFASQTQGIIDAGLLPARLRRQTASMPVCFRG